MIYMFLSNNPSSGDINSSNLPCFYSHFPHSADSRRVVVSYKRNYVHEVLVKCLVKKV